MEPGRLFDQFASAMNGDGVADAANFLSRHFAVGWMDAVMDWHPVYRSDADMIAHAHEIGSRARTFHDPTDSIVFCEMTGK